MRKRNVNYPQRKSKFGRMLQRLSRENKPKAFIQTTRPIQVLQFLISSRSGVSLGRIRNGRFRKGEFNAAKKAAKWLFEGVYVSDVWGMSSDCVRAIARQAAVGYHRHSIRLKAVLIDIPRRGLGS